MSIIVAFLQGLAYKVLDRLLLDRLWERLVGRILPDKGVTESLEAIQDFTEARLDPGAAEMPILGHIPVLELDLLRRSFEENRRAAFSNCPVSVGQV